MRGTTVALLGGAAAAGGLAGALARREHARNLRLAEELLAAEDATLPNGRVVEVRSADGTPIHAEVYGPEQAPTVVLVHGWTCSIRFWHHQLRDLARELRVVAYDKRGHGRTPPAANGDYSLEAHADDLAAVLRALGPEDGRALLAGHSMGAMSIVALAERDGTLLHRRAAAVAMLNTGVGDLISESLVVRGTDRFGVLGERFGELILCSPAPLALPDAVLLAAVRYIALSPQADDEAVALTAEMVRVCHPEARARCAESMTRMELHQALASIELPTLVLAAERDRLTPPKHAHRLASEIGGPVELVELEGVGHMAPLERPGEVNAMLRRLVGEQLDSRRPAAA